MVRAKYPSESLLIALWVQKKKKNFKSWFQGRKTIFLIQFENYAISKMRNAKCRKFVEKKSIGTEITDKRLSKMWVYLASLSSFLEIPENAVIFDSGNFRNKEQMYRKIEQNAKIAVRPRSERNWTNFDFQFLTKRGFKGFGIFSQNKGGLSNHLRKSIFALSLAKNSRIISINWHSRKCYCVSSKTYILRKKETILLKGGALDTLYICLLFCSRWCFLLRDNTSLS